MFRFFNHGVANIGKRARDHNITLVTVIGTIVIGAAAAVLISGRDIPPPDTADLALERVGVPDEENALIYFREAAEDLYWPDNTGRVLSNYLSGEPYDEELVREVIGQNEEVFEKFRKGLEFQRWEEPEKEGYDTPFSYIFSGPHVGKLMAAKAQYAHQKGNNDAATDTTVMLLETGDLISRNARDPIQYLIGLAVLKMGLNQARRITRDPGTCMGDLEHLFDTVERLSPPEHGLKRAIKGEYWLFASVVDRYGKGRKSDLEDRLFFGRIDVLPRIMRFAARFSYLLQPNRTKAAYAQFCRDMIANASRPLGRMEFYDKKDLYGIQRQSPRSFFSTLLRPNGFGKALYEEVTVGAAGEARPIEETPIRTADCYFRSLLASKCKAAAEIDATRLIIACNAYRRKEGQLPEYLQSLVPEYLDSLPVDPYDGELFRYSRFKGIVYSVGKNLKDNGGSSEELFMGYQRTRGRANHSFRWMQGFAFGLTGFSWYPIQIWGGVAKPQGKTEDIVFAIDGAEVGKNQ